MSQLATGTAPGGKEYTVDFAFDWNAGPHPTLGFHLLQIGFTARSDASSGAPASFGHGATVGDSLAFVLYDNTENEANTAPLKPRLDNVEVWFTPTRHNQLFTSPFGLATGLATRPRTTAETTIDSVAYGKSLPAWPLFPDASNPETSQAYQLVNPGRFFLSARVAISEGSDTRTYRVDPEMIISNDGSGGGP